MIPHHPNGPNRELLNRIRGNRRPFTTTNKNGTNGPAKLRIYDEIGIWGVTEEEIASELSQITAAEIEVQISSPGGDVFSGIAIYNALRAHPARITTRVDGIAASIASVIVQAGDRRVMLSASQQMIHPAWGIAIGDSNDMRSMAKLLDRQTDVIAGIYAERSGRPKAAIRKLMDAETWFTDREAVTAGLADEVVNPSAENTKNKLTAEQQAVIAAAEWELWQAEIKEISDRLRVDIAREAFLNDLTTDTRAPVAYTEVPASTMASEVSGRARNVVDTASAALGIEPPQVRWFRTAQPGDSILFEMTPILGLADHSKSTIFLRSGLRGRELEEVAAHEAAHLAGMDEIDAANFGTRYGR